MRLEIKKNTSVPVYIQIADGLRDRIMDGVYTPGFRFPAESDFAAELGINHQTLRKSFRILAEEKLIQQKRGKGTFVTYEAEPLYRIAVVGYDMRTSSGAKWLAGLYEAFSEIRHEFVFLPLVYETGKTLKERFYESKAEALVLYGQTPEILQQLSDPELISVPSVVINAKPSETGNRPCVDVLPNPLRPAVEHLVKLGHRRIGLITRSDKTSNLLERERSFLNSLQEFCLENSPELIVSSEGTHFESGMECALKLVKGKNPVTAIICSGPTITSGAMYGLMKDGIRIPEDVSLIGYDISVSSNPFISTLIQPQYEMAHYAGKMLIDLLRKKTVQNTEIFQVQFEDRGSTGKPKNKK